MRWRAPPRAGIPVVIAYIDVDGLKRANDVHGHAAGDVLLRTAARRVRDAVRSDDVVSRIGGDEFLVVLRGVEGDKDLDAVLDKLRHVVAQPIPDQARDLSTTISIGATRVRPEDTPDSVIDRADRAMYEVKAAGGDGARVV